MSPGQLLEKLENLGIVDEKVLAKIRKEIENPEKNVKPKAVLGYLVKKGQITQQQAARLLKNGKSAPVKEDELSVREVPEEKGHDTSDLIAVGNEEPAPEAEEPAALIPIVDPGATMDDVGLVSPDQGLVEVQPTIAHSVEALEVDPVAVDPAGFADPGGFDAMGGGGLDGGYASGAFAAQPEGDNAPRSTFAGKRDQKDQWATKWLYIGFGILGLILILTAVLWIANMGRSAEDMFEAAMTSYNNGSYADATKKFEDYLDQHSSHKDAKKARALKVNSILRSTYGTKNWAEVIQQADTLLPKLEAEEDNKLDAIRDDLGVMLPRCLVEISAKSKKTRELEKMKSELKVINEYKQVVDNPVYIPNSVRKTPSIADNYAKIDNNIRTIQGQIKKEEDYNASLGEIGNLRNEGRTDDAFGVYQRLTRNYGDLAGRKTIRELMLTISEKERELVSQITPEIGVKNQKANSLIQNTISMAAKNGDAVDSLKGEVVPVLADGSVYGLDAGDGTIAWRYFVGYETSIQPIALGEELIAISNQRDNELIVVDKNSGDIKWRAEFGEPFMTPSVLDRIMVVTTESAKIIQLNVETGAVEQAAKLPQKEANCNALLATRDPYIYQPGLYSNIYVLSNQDYSCKEVFYLGHNRGSIVVPPQAWVGYILVAVNGGDYCDLHVLRPEKNGLGLKLVQSFSRITNGTVSTPFQRFGRLMLMASDTGEMRILELNPSDESNPVRVFANDRFETKGGLTSFFLTEGSNLWVAGKGLIRYRIKRNEGKFAREVITEGTDTFLSQIHKLDDYLLHVRRRYRSGMISATICDAKTLKPIWRTDFAGEMAGAPIKYGNKFVAVSNQGDMFSFGADEIGKGFTDNAVRSSTVVQDLMFSNLVQIDDDTFACVGPAERKDILYAKGSTEQSKLMTMSAPADKPACRPLVLDKFLIVPAVTGQVAKIDPKTGQLAGTPFLPGTKPGIATLWQEPVLIQGSTFAVAHSMNEAGDPSMLYLLDAGGRKINLVDKLESEASIKSRLVTDGKSIFAVTDAGGDEKLVSFSSKKPLAIGGEYDLDGSLVDGPWLTENGLFVKLDDDNFYCFGTDLSLKWKVELPDVQLATKPSMIGSQLMLTMQDGSFKMLDPTSGDVVREFSVGQPIIHQPLIDQQKMYISGLDGTVHVVDLQKLSQ